MNGHHGFSYVGLLFLSALFIPNIIWTKNLPQGYTSENENKILLAFERLGEVLTCCCALIFSDFNLHGVHAAHLRPHHVYPFFHRAALPAAHTGRFSLRRRSAAAVLPAYAAQNLRADPLRCHKQRAVPRVQRRYCRHERRFRRRLTNLLAARPGARRSHPHEKCDEAGSDSGRISGTTIRSAARQIVRVLQYTKKGVIYETIL